MFANPRAFFALEFLMELPDPFLPGAISLLDQLDKRLMVMLRDGKTLIGDLRTIDQFANLVLQNTLERIYVDKCYGDIPRGIFMIRGENVVLAGELGDENPPQLKKVSLQEILRMQADKHEQQEKRAAARKRMMSGRGRVNTKADIFTDELKGQSTQWIFAPSGDLNARFSAARPFRRVHRAAQPRSAFRSRVSAPRGVGGSSQLFASCRKSDCPSLPQIRFVFVRQLANMPPVAAPSAVRPFNVVFVLGPPGSGKGTQCDKIRQKFGFVHLSAGELLRREMETSGELAASIRSHMTAGTIVPVAITCKLLEEAMNAAGDAPGFLIDGFPRNRDNLDGWQKEMSGKVREHFVLFLKAPFDICLARCLARPGGRPDDNSEAYAKRIETYNTQTLPIIDYYAAKGQVREVDSTPDLETVFENVRKIFTNAGFPELGHDAATTTA
ncbi:Like-Sm ribonucleoprotein and Adenylate kinase domain containing protein [Aphelenchoides fujianensis]|nr:Like-Sm ribonucleoprotein and Adenylate kinase domain containing protein [Aphelenchoides fujianensis]